MHEVAPVATVVFGQTKRWFEWDEPGSGSESEDRNIPMNKDREEEEALIASYEMDDVEAEELEEEALAATNVGISHSANENENECNENEYKYEERLREITDRGKFCPNQEWCWRQPDPSKLPTGRLRSILEGPEGKTVGLCFSVDPSSQKPIQLEDSYLSMLRLMEYCDMNPIHSRKFLDGLLDIVAEEITTRNFNLLNRPRRETVARKVMEMYGVGCEPEIAVLTTANEESHIVLIEKPAPPPKRGERH